MFTVTFYGTDHDEHLCIFTAYGSGKIVEI